MKLLLKHPISTISLNSTAFRKVIVPIKIFTQGGKEH